jgi:hypothetical protein
VSGARELDARAIQRAAEAETGLTDWGGDGFREPMRVLVDSIARESELSERELAQAGERLVALAVNRLRLVEDRRRDRGIAEQPIERPIFVLGLPRSGTTLLHGLFAADPANRLPRFWEVLSPSPPPDAGSEARDPRIESAGKALAWVLRDNPMLAVHYPPFASQGALAPIECSQITEMDFSSFNFWGGYRVPSFIRFLLGADLRPSYEFHRRFLQHLQARRPRRRWVLKSPPHLSALGDLRAVYPDACFVWIHRDPARVMPSLASLLSASRRAGTAWHGLAADAAPPHSACDPAAIGDEVLELWCAMIAKAMSYRARSGDDGVLDVSYSDFTGAPVETVRAIYAHFGIAYTDAFEAGLRRALAESRARGRERHSYALDGFGYTPERIARSFGEYIERFSIPPERA